MTAQPTDTPTACEVEILNFDTLYRENIDDIYAYIAGVLRNQSAAEEVTSAVFERAYSKRKRYSSKRGTPRSWLFTMARSAALDELRRLKRHAEPTEDVTKYSDSTRQLEDQSVERITLQRALKKLDIRERELVALKFYAGLSNKETAQVLGISESNTGTLLHRTIEKVRKACNDSGT